MTHPSIDDSQSGVSGRGRSHLLGLLVRISLPILCLIGGFYAYQQLSIEVPKEVEPAAQQKLIRTRVAQLRTQNYPIVIHKNGIVQSHNHVSLSAEVTGNVTAISPAFEVGSYFVAGDVLVELDARDYATALAMAQAQRDGATAALELAELNYQQQNALVQRNAAPQADLNQALAARAQAESALDAAKIQVDQAKRDLERTKIRAPFDGRVRVKDVGLGQFVGPGTALGTIFAVDFAEVRLPIAGPELQYVDLPEHAGDTPINVELRDAIDPNSETIWTAQIVRTEGVLDENSLELYAIARIDDPFGLKSGQPPLRIGQPVIGSIAGKLLQDVVAIPRTSIRQMDQVYLIDKTELTLSAKTIAPVWSDAQYVLIRDPQIPDGTLVSTTRMVYAPDGAKVEIIPEVESVTATVSANVKSESDPKSATN